MHSTCTPHAHPFAHKTVHSTPADLLLSGPYKVPQPTCDSNLKHQAGQRAAIFRDLAAMSVAAACALLALAHQVPAWSLLHFPLPHMCICTAASHPSPRSLPPRAAS
eukprot:scaffold109748_cov63-Phaeocystis_antarctica.AAC.1